MTEASTSPRSLRDYSRFFRRNRWLILIVTVLAAAAAVGLSLSESKSYTATAIVNFVDPLRNAGILNASSSNTSPATFAAAGVDQLTERSTLSTVKASLHATPSVSELQGDISAVADPNTNLVTVSAKAASPALAAGLANGVSRTTKAQEDRNAAATFSKLATQYRHQLAGLSPSDRRNSLVTSALVENLARASALAKGGATAAEIVSTATPPSSPSSPDPPFDGIIGAFLGFLLGLLIAGVREALDRRLRGPEEIETELDLPILGRIREQALGEVARAGQPGSGESAPDLEAFRILRSNLASLGAENQLRTVVVTSSLPEEGKTTVAISLALASAAAGRRTLLVECDLRRPALSKRLDVTSKIGLSDFVLGNASPEEVVQTVDVGAPISPQARSSNGSAQQAGGQLLRRLAVITAGSHTSQPAELLGSEEFKAFLAEVASVYDVVFLDTAPLLPVADTLELVPRVDAVLICLRASCTTREQVQAAKAALDRFPPRPMAVVLTGARDPHGSDSYSYPYAYSYESSPDQPANGSPGRRAEAVG